MHRVTHRHAPVTPPSTLQPTATAALHQHNGLSLFAHSSSRLFLLLLLFRSLSALLLVTYFNPDEPWQSLEVAHSVAYPPFGHRTWEWTAPARIRGWLHVFPFILFYQLIRTFRIDTPFIVAYGPRLLQAMLVAVADVHFHRLAKRLLGDAAGEWAMLCYLTNWFLCYTLPRTYSNSLETCLTILALAHWPWPALPSPKPLSPSRSSSPSLRVSLLLAAVAVAVRPTALITWLVLGGQFLLALHSWRVRLRFVQEAAVIGGSVLLCSLVLDRWLYGEWTVVAFNFFSLNSLHSISSLYGTHPGHWYFTEALPVILTPSGLFLFLYAVYRYPHHSLTRSVLPLVLTSLLAYSSNAHKEYRFILPLMPLLLLFCGLSLSSLQSTWTATWTARKPHLLLLLSLNLSAFLYFGLIHQAGPISAVHFFSTLHTARNSGGLPLSVHFWMPCHSTPLYSYLHIHPMPELRFFDCAPTLPPLPDPSPIIAFSRQCTSSHLFTQSPLGFVRHLYNLSAPMSTQTTAAVSDECVEMRRRWNEEDEGRAASERRGGGRFSALPSYVVMFDTFEAELSELLKEVGYEEVRRLFHAHFGDEREVLVWERRETAAAAVIYR